MAWLEIATNSGHRVHTKRGGARLHRGRIDRSKVLSPFQEICTPIHRRMNDDRRMTTSIAASPSNAAILSAKRCLDKSMAIMGLDHIPTVNGQRHSDPSVRLAPTVMATAIEPGPTVNGSVNG